MSEKLTKLIRGIAKMLLVRFDGVMQGRTVEIAPVLIPLEGDLLCLHRFLLSPREGDFLCLLRGLLLLLFFSLATLSARLQKNYCMDFYE